MPKRRLQLNYPDELVYEPVLYEMATRFRVIPNILPIRVTEALGEMVVELDGDEGDLDAAIAYLEQRGVRVRPLARRKVQLKYPEALIKEPVLFQMAMRYYVVPNIRRARVTESVGEIVLELEGTREGLEAGIRYLEDRGIQVQPLEGGVVE